MTDNIFANGNSQSPHVTLIEPLEYPRDFFDLKKGGNPPNLEAAALLWPYRKDRPRRGAVEMVAPNGAVMMAECDAMRQSVRNYIQKKFMDDARRVAKELNFTMVCGTVPITPKDLKNALQALDNTVENRVFVYRICHEFHRDRSWMADAIDEWFIQENMVLLPSSDKSRRKKYTSDRGGFSVIARNAKAQALGGLMNPMLAKVGWCIARTNNQRNSKLSLYTGCEYSDGINKPVIYYLMTSSVTSEGCEGENLHPAIDFCNDDDEEKQLVDLSLLDYSGMASMMTLLLGVEVNATTMLSVVARNVVTHENLSGRTMLLEQKEDTLTTMTPVDALFSTTIRTCAHTDPIAQQDLPFVGCQTNNMSVNEEGIEDMEGEQHYGADNNDCSTTTVSENERNDYQYNFDSETLHVNELGDPVVKLIVNNNGQTDYDKPSSTAQLSLPAQPSIPPPDNRGQTDYDQPSSTALLSLPEQPSIPPPAPKELDRAIIPLHVSTIISSLMTLCKLSFMLMNINIV